MQKTILSTYDVARLFNVTETTVKRWADEGTLRCQRTPGGHRKFQIKNVIEFAENNNFEPVGILSLPNADGLGPKIEVAVMNRDYATLSQAYVEKALSPDPLDLYSFFSYLYEHRVQLWEIYDNVLRPGMREIGDRWAGEELGISQEHRASYETLDALARLQAEIFVKPRTGYSVLCAAFGEEMHEIGLRCTAFLFEAEGWKTHYLGARSPGSAIHEAVRDLKPTVVALSVTYTSDDTGMFDDLKRIAEAARRSEAQVILGGSGLRPEWGAAGVFDGLLRSAQETVAYIETFGSAAKRKGREN
jgi:MerR family transcriptional regulator, light-induced transcriptional regulator